LGILKNTYPGKVQDAGIKKHRIPNPQHLKYEEPINIVPDGGDR
jgi:hypothetical protein